MSIIWLISKTLDAIPRTFKLTKSNLMLSLIPKKLDPKSLKMLKNNLVMAQSRLNTKEVNSKQRLYPKKSIVKLSDLKKKKNKLQKKTLLSASDVMAQK